MTQHLRQAARVLSISTTGTEQEWLRWMRRQLQAGHDEHAIMRMTERRADLQNRGLAALSD